jgi:hypothetical protein
MRPIAIGAFVSLEGTSFTTQATEHHGDLPLTYIQFLPAASDRPALESLNKIFHTYALAQGG